MEYKYLALSALTIPVISLLAFRTSYSFFSDAAHSTNNTFAAASVFPTPTPIPGIANHLVISEVQIKGATANEDYVELYNPTGSDVNLGELAGWKIRVRNSAGTETSLVLITSGTIKAHGYFLWSNDDKNFNTAVGADVHNGNNISENNSLALKKPDNTIVDQLAWGTGSNQFVEGVAFSGNPGANKAIERKAISTSTESSMSGGGSDITKGNGYDTDNNFTDFVLQTTPDPNNSSSPTELP